MNDWELLQAWAGQRSDAAFTELVRRYVDLVYAAARRQVDEPELARDVSQAVFLALAQKAGSLSSQVVLGGWLLRTTRFVASRARRTEIRRQQRETAATMETPTSDSPPAPDHWAEVAPELDAALSALSTGDRDLVVLRYFEHKSMAEVGDRLGIGEDTAKKRVSRALERLRRQFAQRGVVLTVAALTVLLTQLPTQAAPVGLVTSVTAAVTPPAVSAPVAWLTQTALRQWFFVGVRRMLPWAAVLIACFWLAAIQWSTAANRSNPLPLAVETNVAAILTAVPGPTAVGSASTIPDAPAQVGPSKILLSVRSINDNSPLRARLRILRSSPRGWMGRTEMEADPSGTAEIVVHETNIWFVIVQVSAPGYVPVELKWNRHEFVEPVLLHTCRLQTGLTLAGLVQDENGNPVEGATVEVHYDEPTGRDRETIGFSSRLSGVKTDTTGRFSLNQLPANFGTLGGILAVKHSGHVWQRVPLKSPAGVHTNHVITLMSGAKLSGRVVNEHGQPIANAEVRPDSLVPQERPTESTKTDSAGEFTLGRFRPGRLPLEVSGEKYETRRQVIEVGEIDQRISFTLATSEDDDPSVGEDQLPSTVRIVGTVVDDESGEPIPSFTVRFSESRSSVTGLIGEGHDGRFDWPVHLRNSGGFALEFETVGYEVQVTELHPADRPEERFATRMRKNSELSGRVVHPDGTPVRGAAMVLSQFEESCWLFDGRLSDGMQLQRTVTDANGRYSLKTHPEAARLLVVTEEGCSQWIVGKPRPDPLVLQPWGTIEGIVELQGKPAANETVLLWPAPALEAGGIPGIDQQQTVVTDAEGRFRCERVAAGPVRLDRVQKRPDGTLATTHRQRVEAQPGQVVQVRLGGGGKGVTGRLKLSQPVANFDWQTDLQYLTEKKDFPAMPQSGPPGTRAHFEYMNELNRRSDLKLRLGLSLDADGRFHVEDVPAGEYELVVRIAPPPTESPAGDDPQRMIARMRRLSPQLSLGGLTNRCVVSADDSGVVDLGTLIVPVRN